MPPPKKHLAPKCHLKRHLTGSWQSTLIRFFSLPEICYTKCFLTKMYSCIFASDAINLMVSCSLLVLYRKLLLVLRKSTKTVTSRAALFGSDINSKSFGGWGFTIDPAGGAYSTPPDLLAVFMGLLLREKREVKGRGWRKGAY